MPAIIFFLLVIAIVLVGVGWVMEVVGGIVGGVWNFLINLHYAWLIGFAVVSLTIAIIRRIRSHGEHSIVWTMTQLTALAMAIVFIVVPLANGRRWNHTFNCADDSQCRLDNKCVAGFCTIPFAGDHLGQAEFTQGQWRQYMTEKVQDQCHEIGKQSRKNWNRQYECENSIDETIDEIFKKKTSPEHCQYLDLPTNPKKALMVHQDAPMPCLSRDEAALICADLGGRLPTRQEYESLFEETDFSCRNTVMSGLDEFNGLIRKIKAREIKRMKYGAGCGSGKARKACDKFHSGNTAEGFCDVFGNVAEWTADGGAVGGGFRSSASAMREEIVETGPRIDIGFRCLIFDEGLVY